MKPDRKLFIVLLLFRSLLFAQDLIPFRDGFKMGFCNKELKVVIPPKYDLVFPFEGNRAVVFENITDNQFYLIDRNGQKISPAFSYCTIEYPERYGDIYLFCRTIGYYAIIDTNGNYRLENFNGTIKEFRGNYAVFYKKESENSLYGVVNIKYGVVNKKGEIIIPAVYQNLSDYAEGLFAAQNLNNKWGFIDSSGKVIIPFQYEKAFPFSEGLAATKFNGKFGFIDKSNKVVIAHQYDLAYIPFSEGLTTVGKDKSALLINKKGEVVKNLGEVSVGKFLNGRAVIGKYSSDGWRYGYIDPKGDIVIPMNYTKAYNFTDIGIGVAQKKINNQYLYGFIDKNGKELTPFEYYSVGDGFFELKKCFDKNEFCLVHLSIFGARSEFYVDKSLKRYSTHILPTTDNRYITAEYKKQLEQEEAERARRREAQREKKCVKYCPKCGGIGGYYDYSTTLPCLNCLGSGISHYTKLTLSSPFGGPDVQYTPHLCTKCGGKGIWYPERELKICDVCRGGGCIE